MTLTPCTSCHRHALATEAACPFCGEALSDPSPRPRQRYIRRVGIIAAMASGLSGCPSGAGGNAGTGAVPPYGLPPEPDMVVDVDGGDDEPGDDDAGT